MGDLRLRERGTGRRSTSFAVPECRHCRERRAGQDAPFVRFRDGEVDYIQSIRVCVETRDKEEQRDVKKQKNGHGQGCINSVYVLWST